MEPIRLQKYFTDCGVLSRRAAEAEIAAGKVTVNGEVATIGQKIDPDRDTVIYKGKKLTKSREARHTVLLNKPRGVVTTLSDEKGRQTVADLIKNTGLRLYPVGRLDMDSDGLLLLTDDGELANHLTHPRHEIPKYYHVTVRGAVSETMLARLCEPFLLDGYETRPVKVTLLAASSKETVLLFPLYEGRNRQIRHLCEAAGLTVRRLIRVSIGNLKLDGLGSGKWRYLTPDEVAYLYKATKG